MVPFAKRMAWLGLAVLVPQLAVSTAEADTLGTVTFRRADSASLIGTGGSSFGWLNVVNAAVDLNTALTSAPLESTGYANMGTGTVIEYTFAAGVANGPGPDLVVFDAQFDVATMDVSTSHDAFAARVAVSGWTSTGVARTYYYERSAGPYTATVYAGTVDLSDLGVPDGATVGTIRTIATNVGGDPIGVGALAGVESVCNGVDDDGDGAIDEDYVPMATTCGTGACAAVGVTSCVSGTVQDSCTPGTPAATDATCNGVDDDCDGAEDEDYVAVSTTCGTGACAAAGVASCVSGTVQDSCTPGTPAADDATCDGVDDDCDGAIDEDYFPGSTTCGTGACAAVGVTSCVSGTLQESCTPGTPAADDATCDGVDDDCDGMVDEDDGDCVVDAGTPLDAGEPTDGSIVSDGARPADATAVDAGGRTGRRSSRGCGCRLAPIEARDADVPLWLGLLLGVALRLRRRRRGS